MFKHINSKTPKCSNHQHKALIIVKTPDTKSQKPKPTSLLQFMLKSYYSFKGIRGVLGVLIKSGLFISSFYTKRPKKGIKNVVSIAAVSLTTIVLSSSVTTATAANN